MSDLDLVAIMAEHSGHNGDSQLGTGCIETLHVEVPCLPYLLAERALKAEGRLARVEALLPKFILVYNDGYPPTALHAALGGDHEQPKPVEYEGTREQMLADRPGWRP